MTLSNLLGKSLEMDAMRKQRNVADYSGDIVPESAVMECIKQAEKLLKHFKMWLGQNENNLRDGKI